MFKRKPILIKRTAHEQRSSLSNLNLQRTTKSKIELVLPQKSHLSRDSKSSLKNQQPKQRSLKKQQPHGRGSLETKSKPSLTPKRSVDLMSEYENVVKLSQKMSERGRQSKPMECQYRSLPQPIIPPDADLFCDEELETHRPFPIMKTPSPIRSLSHFNSAVPEKCGLELSIVQERIISEQDKEIVSDKKKKTHLRNPTASTADRTNNTAKDIQEADRNNHRSISPFEIANRTNKPPKKICINVHSLVAKSRRPDHKYPSSQNTMR